jgi:hypothetical protein
MFCPFCNAESRERIQMRPDGTGRAVPTRLCGAGHVLPTEASVVDVPPAAKEAVITAVGHAMARSPESKPFTADLPSIIRARKKELRANIKRDQRELAQLERLTTSRARKSATVTSLKRSGT